MGRVGGVQIAASAIAIATLAGVADAQELRSGGKLLLTGGVSSLEGASGGGLATWAVIAGDETRDGIGGAAHATRIEVNDFALTSYGAAVGLFDRVEVSLATQEFDTEDAGAALGLGRGFAFHQTVLGLKVKLAGDAVYDQDKILPQISIGVQRKSNDRGAVLAAIGAAKDHGADYFITATKIVLDQSLLLNATIRATTANQTGLLGFGGDRNRDYHAEFEGSVGYLLSRRLVVGAEYRSKPDNLGFAKESDWGDAFAAYAINKTVSVTAAYMDLGDIATFRRERGFYVSVQAGF